MKRNLLLLLLLICTMLSHLVKAQGINASPTGDACPNRDYTYTYGGSTLGCSWVVKGAYTLVSGGGANSNFITLKWSDIPTNATSNPTSVGLSCGAGGSPPTISVFVNSISDITPSPLQVNGSTVANPWALPFGDNTPLTLRVGSVELPQSAANPNPILILTYDWVIPSGWRYNDGTNYVSDGTTVHRVTVNGNQPGNQVSVTPAPGTGGTISVQAINDRCVANSSAGAVNSHSKASITIVTRPTPTLTVISDRSPSGGNFTLTCGDQSDYHFRSTSSAVPTGGAFSGYSFVFSGPITPTGTVNSATPATNFTGNTGTVGVSLSATYTRNGASTTVYTGISATVQPLPKPIIANAPAGSGTGQYPAVCAPITVSASVAGANSYTWTATGGLGVGGPGQATFTSTGTSATIYPGSGSGQGYVTVQATNTLVSSCASPASDRLNLLYGPPTDRGSFAFYYQGQRFDYPTNGPSNGGLACPSESITVSLARPSPGIVLESRWQLYRTDTPTPQLLATTTSTAPAPLYFQLGSTVGLTYQAQYQERNACGWGAITYFQLETIDCNGGYEPFRTAGPPTTPPTKPKKLEAFEAPAAAYPNPAHEVLTISHSSGLVVLRNVHGRVVSSQVAETEQVRLDTSQLPNGLYFLEMRAATGQVVRQQIQVTH